MSHHGWAFKHSLTPPWTDPWIGMYALVDCPSRWSLYLSLALWVESQHHSNRETGTAMYYRDHGLNAEMKWKCHKSTNHDKALIYSPLEQTYLGQFGLVCIPPAKSKDENIWKFPFELQQKENKTIEGNFDASGYLRRWETAAGAFSQLKCDFILE